MRNLRSLIILLFILAVPVNAAVQWSATTGGNNHWYEPVLRDSTDTHWAEARDAAVARGGYLATITSPEENAFVYLLINADAYWQVKGVQFNGPWLGGYQDTTGPAYSEPSGAWNWITGEIWNYTNWGVGQPDNYLNDHQDILHFWYPIGASRVPFWDDCGALDVLNSYVIEWDSNPVPEPSTILALLCGLGGVAWRRR